MQFRDEFAPDETRPLKDLTWTIIVRGVLQKPSQNETTDQISHSFDDVFRVLVSDGTLPILHPRLCRDDDAVFDSFF